MDGRTDGEMQRQVFDQEMESTWAGKASVALKQGDIPVYRDTVVNWRVFQVIVIARRDGWGSWKTRAVCKYVGKVYTNMVLSEVSAIGEQAARELVEHAAEGFDSFARRRAARV